MKGLTVNCAHSVVLRWPVLLFFVALAATAPTGRGQTAHFGLHFLDETTEIENGLFYHFEDGNAVFHNTYGAVFMTDPNMQAVQHGGLIGWTEEQFRAAVVVAVERIYRDVDTGDPNTTLRMNIYKGPVSAECAGRRLNVVLGSNSEAGENTLGMAWYDMYANPLYEDGFYPAAVLMDHLDNLSGVQFDTPEGVINNIAGTTAHELGHVFALDHVQRGSDMPYPIMCTGGEGLSNADRLTERRFTGQMGTQGSGDSSETLLTASLGTVHRADFDMDGDVDIVEFSGDGVSDLSTLLSNVGLSEVALMRHGDADNDQDVDIVEFVGDGISDFNILLAGVGSPSVQGDSVESTSVTLEVVYDTTSGKTEFRHQGKFDFLALGVVDLTMADEAAVVQNAHQNQSLLYLDDNQALFNSNASSEALVWWLPPGLGASDIHAFGQSAGKTSVVPLITVVPEPATMALLGLGGLAVLRRRRK